MSSDEESDNHYISEEEVEPPKRKRAKKKDPNRPKRNMSAFFLYSNAHRPRIKEENAGIAFGAVAKLLSVEFKQITAEDRQKWDELALEDKKRYQRQMENYTPLSEDSEEETTTKKKKKKKDPNAPKRNLSAYFIYSQEVRSSVRENNPQASFGGIAKLISAQFKTLDTDERAKYDKLAALDKERYQRQMAEYKGENI